jgi:predicted esterase
MFIIPEGFQYAWFTDLPAEELNKWGTTLKPFPLGSLITPVQQTGLSPNHWRLSYLVTTGQDPAMPEAFQKFLIQTARDAGAEVDSLEIESGHFVQISHAEEVAKWISEVT